MITPQAGPRPHEALFRRVVPCAGRVLTVSAPPGYDKHAFLHAYAARVGPVVEADLDPRRDRDPARAIAAAIASRDRTRAARFAADRLAQRSDVRFRTAREALRRDWQNTDGPEMLIVRDAVGTLGTADGVDLLAELVATLPAERTLALTTRRPLPPAAIQALARRECDTLDEHDLALSAEETLRAAESAGISSAIASRLHAVTAGWPLVTRLLLMAAQNDPDALLGELETLPPVGLLPFAAHRVIASLDERLREAVVACAVRRVAATTDLVDVLGDRCDEGVLLRLRGLPFVTVEGELASVHPDVASLLKTRFAALTKRIYEQTVATLVAQGAHVAAARTVLEQRDAERALALLDAASPYSGGAPALADYERVLERVDHELVLRYPNVWMATIGFRRFAVDRETYIREAETIYYCLPYSASPRQQALAVMHLSSAYFNVGRVEECDALVEPALETLGTDPEVRTTLLNFVASLHGERGRYAQARSLARQAAHLARQDFTETIALHHIDAVEAIARGRYDRAMRIFDELLRRQSRDEQPLYYGYAATDAAFCAWMYGDDDAFRRYIGLLEDALTPGLEPGFARMIEASYGRPMTADERYAWPVHVAISELYRLGHAAEGSEAIAAARRAAAAADERRDPFVQTLAHAALYLLDPGARASSADAVRAAAAQIESPELVQSVEALIAGTGFGILETFVQRRVMRARTQAHSTLSVELLSARVCRDGTPIKLSGKELELVALLASTFGPLSRDRIGEALWEHLEPEEWSNNLKVTISRLRAKLGEREAIVFAEGNYRLSRDVDVDLRRYENAVREMGDGPLGEASRATMRAIVDAYGSGTASRYDRFAWMQPVVARITDLVCAAGIALANDALRSGKIADALRFAQTVVGVDPFSERACEIIMRAHISEGDPDAARREFRRYARALDEQLDAEPAAHLTDLLESLD